MMDLVDARTIFRQRAAGTQIPTRAIQKRFEVGHGGGVGQRGSSETRERVEGACCCQECCCIDLQGEGTSHGES